MSLSSKKFQAKFLSTSTGTSKFESLKENLSKFSLHSQYKVLNKIPVLFSRTLNSEQILVCSVSHLQLVLSFLKWNNRLRYDSLSCISGVDFIGKKFRFSVCYELLSIFFNSRLRLKIYLNEVSSVPSIISLFPNANWWEREIWDLYGLIFENHSDLRRLLTDYGFEGSPLRKDFPLVGYFEVRYDEITKRIVSEPVELSQEFRVFDSRSSW